MDTSVPLVTPSAALPRPTAEDLEQLQRVGHAFHADGERHDLPVDPSKVSARTMRPGSRLGRFVEVGTTTDGVGEIEAVTDPARTGTRGERGAGGLRRALLGPPLNSTALQQERMDQHRLRPVDHRRQGVRGQDGQRHLLGTGG